MKTIAHLSDLHFGTEDAKVAAAVQRDLDRHPPDLLVVSGDLTQRARRGQFRSARDYLRGLPSPQLIIPGNHDIPLFHVWRRFLQPLVYYREYISNELNPVFRDGELLVIGLNTARSFTWKNGRISGEQMTFMEETLNSAGPEVFKIVVTHHPFIPPPGEAEAGVALVGRASKALTIIDRGGVDLLLAGHLHEGYTGDVRTFYPAATRSVIVAQAGTAISRRLRTTPNAYNLITVQRGHLSIESRTWDGNEFRSSSLFALPFGNRTPVVLR